MRVRIWNFSLCAILLVFAAATVQGQTFTISGRITEPPANGPVGISAVNVTLTINASTQMMTQTNNNGDFSFSNIAAGSNYEVTPTKPNYVFHPVSQGGTIQSNVMIFFTGETTAANATIQFSAANQNINEDGGSLLLTVTRTGETSGAATVNYTTSDTSGTNPCNMATGAASSRCDYGIAIGKLRFAANETMKTISIPIIDDSYMEGNETFTVVLGNPTGATLGAPSTATVTIIDNDAVTGPNPVDQASFFVRQHFIDFLNREPDAGGLAFWTNEIASCGADAACIEIKRINVSAAFYLSIEFQETGYLVYRMYKAAYGNIPGAPAPVRLLEFLPDTQEIGRGVVVGQGDWQTQLENNKNAFAAEFVTGTRFTTAYPDTISAAQYVDTLNQNAGGVLSQAVRDQLVNDLTMGAKTRAQVLRAVSEDADLVQMEFNRAFVLMQYFGYLRRNPDDAPDSDFGGYNFWLGKLNDFNGNFVNAEMVKAFIVSSEYRQRFGP